MNLFRSEEHLTHWLDDRPEGAGVGARLTVARLNQLAHAWWEDRLDPDWRPHTRAQNQSILQRLGLTGEFWRLG